MKTIYYIILNLLLSPLLRAEKRKQVPIVNERPVEYAFALEWLSKAPGRKVLDVGSGRTSFPHLLYTCGFDVRSIDLNPPFNRHFKVEKADITKPITGMYDAITCISVLEHIPDDTSAVENMFNALNSNGLLILSFPYNEERYVNNVNKHGLTKVFHRGCIDSVRRFGLDIIDQRYYQVFTGDIWAEGERLTPIETTVNDKHHLTCVVFRKV